MRKILWLSAWGVWVVAVCVLWPAPAAAGGQVGGGTPASCNQPALEAKLTGGGLVTFNCGPAPVTIVLTSFVQITLPTTLDGGGLITLSGGDVTGILDHESGALTLRNLTLRDGFTKGGGAIYNGAPLTVVNTNFISNSALAIGGAIYSNAPMTITGGLFFSNTTGFGEGGAIYSTGSALIVGARFVSNTAAFGGGAIVNDVPGVMVIRASTIQSNTGAVNGAGGIWNSSLLTMSQDSLEDNGIFGNTGPRLGGGLYQTPSGHALVSDSTFIDNFGLGGGGLVTSGTLTVFNSTLAGNTAFGGGGALVQSGTLEALNATFAGNVGILGTAAIATSGSGQAQLVNTIVAGDPVNNCSGSVVSGGHNLEDGHTCNLNVVSDISNTNPLLGEPGYFGGPTRTVPLLPGSPAINHGDNVACPSNDQRGLLRVDGCDIGAFEFYAAQVLLPLVKR